MHRAVLTSFFYSKAFSSFNGNYKFNFQAELTDIYSSRSSFGKGIPKFLSTNDDGYGPSVTFALSGIFSPQNYKTRLKRPISLIKIEIKY